VPKKENAGGKNKKMLLGYFLSVFFRVFSGKFLAIILTTKVRTKKQPTFPLQNVVSFCRKVHRFDAYVIPRTPRKPRLSGYYFPLTSQGYH